MFGAGVPVNPGDKCLLARLKACWFSLPVKESTSPLRKSTAQLSRGPTQGIGEQRSFREPALGSVCRASEAAPAAHPIFRRQDGGKAGHESACSCALSRLRNQSAPCQRGG
jgi:hypothetical protein